MVLHGSWDQNGDHREGAKECLSCSYNHAAILLATYPLGWLAIVDSISYPTAYLHAHV